MRSYESIASDLFRMKFSSTDIENFEWMFVGVTQDVHRNEKLFTYDNDFDRWENENLVAYKAYGNYYWFVCQ